MSRISDAREVITDARDESERRLKRAEELYDDFAGKMEHGGLTLHTVGGYVLVDDDSDRWIAATSDYVDALKTVLTAVIEKGHYLDDSEGKSAPYDALCSECPALYSRIGAGLHNDDVSSLLEKLAETLEEDDVNEIAEYLGIELDYEVEAEETETADVE